MRILIVDDHVCMRQTLVRVFQEASEMQVVGEAADGYAAVQLARQLKPDVVVMDVEMPRLDGISATRQILTEYPDMRIVGLSTHCSGVVVKAMLAAGASAYVLKDDLFPDLIEAVEAVTEGQTYLSPSLTNETPVNILFASPLSSCCNGAEATQAGRLAGL
jgi:DNA-binding NarL/FixJ family response regulator